MKKSLRINLRIVVGLLFAAILLANAALVLAQKTQTTENKADSNLKSSARVNPSTQAMEFSIPLASYPGRNGNSIPIVFNYSSKVWSMERLQLRSQTTDLGNNQFNVLLTTDISAIFAKKNVAGWTSSLQPPAIIEQSEIYNQTGELFLFSDNLAVSQKVYTDSLGINTLIDEDNGWSCHIVDTYEGNNNTCATGFGRTIREMCVNNTTGEKRTVPTTFCMSLGDPNQDAPPNPNPDPNPSNAPAPQTVSLVKRISVQMPDGSTHEFRKNKIVSN